MTSTKQPFLATERLEDRILLSSKILTNVPFYVWYYGCAPSVAAEIMGYYDRQGYSNIFPGTDASYRDGAVSNAMASTPFIVAGAENGRKTWDGKTGGDWGNSRSYPNHANQPSCLADFMHVTGDQTIKDWIAPGMQNYLKWRGYGGFSIKEVPFSWNMGDIVNEINAGHPLFGLVDIWAQGTFTHAAPIIGYNTDNNTFAVLDQSTPGKNDPTVPHVQWWPWLPVQKGRTYGVYSYMKIDPPGGAPISSTPAPAPTPVPATPFSGSAITMPGTIQAENFDNGSDGLAYHDNDGGNFGGQYRNTNVDVQGTNDAGGGYDVGWTHAGEWMQYTVNVTSPGANNLDIRVASPTGGGKFHVELDGANITGSITMPNTGGWQNWTTITRTNINLPGGQHALKLVMETNDGTGQIGNFNWLRVTPVAPAAAVAEAPHLGTPFHIGDTIDAENYDNGGEGVAYHDTEASNFGAKYRNDGVDIEAANDSGGGYDVGWARAGEWMKYTIDVATAGTYNLNVRVASAVAGGKFHVELDGVNVTGSMGVPATGGWQNWQTLTKTGIGVSAGSHVLRLVMETAAPNGFVGNFNWMKLS